jgi:hypothetical protein
MNSRRRRDVIFMYMHEAAELGAKSVEHCCRREAPGKRRRDATVPDYNCNSRDIESAASHATFFDTRDSINSCVIIFRRLADAFIPPV